eukprot:1198940-Prymnesium_polylepis.1
MAGAGRSDAAGPAAAAVPGCIQSHDAQPGGVAIRRGRGLADGRCRPQRAGGAHALSRRRVGQAARLLLQDDVVVSPCAGALPVGFVHRQSGGRHHRPHGPAVARASLGCARFTSRHGVVWPLPVGCAPERALPGAFAPIRRQDLVRGRLGRRVLRGRGRGALERCADGVLA